MTWPSGAGGSHRSPRGSSVPEAAVRAQPGAPSAPAPRGTSPPTACHRPETTGSTVRAKHPWVQHPWAPFAYHQVTARDVARSPAPGARELRPSSARERAGPGPGGDNGSATRSPVNELSFVPQPTLHQARPLRTVPSWD